MMNKDYLLFHLKEGLEQLSRTVSECESDPSYSEGQLLLDMQHLYHHLNTAWNTREVGPQIIAQASDHDFNLWGSYPADLKTLAI